MRHRVPSAPRRLLRNRFAVLAVVTLSVFASGAAVMRESASVELLAAVDSNWRGAYDVLVRPSGAQLDLEQTNGLVEPNYVVFAGEGGISLEELQAIRSLPGVELAAPVAMIGNVRYLTGGPVITGLDLPAEPTLYDVTVRVIASDGIHDRLVQAESGRVLLGPADLSAAELPFATDLGSLSWSTDGWSVLLTSLPPIVSPLIAVDPVAEAKLLPGTATFLEPLALVAELPEAPTADSFDLALIPDKFDAQRSYVSMLSGLNTSGGMDRPVIPVAVSSTIFVSLRVELAVSQVGEPIGTYPSGSDEPSRLAAAAEAAGSGRSELDVVTVDLDEQLRPLQPPRIGVVWPGSRPPLGSTASIGSSPDLSADLAGRPVYEPAQDRRDGGSPLAYAPEPIELVDSSGERVDHPTGGRVERGLETAYRPSQPAPLPLLESFAARGPLDRPFAYAPVSEFDLRDILLPDNPLNYVPLGAYVSPDISYVANAAGQEVRPQALRPTLNPRGLVNVPPLAMTDLRSAVTLRGARPIDAIRVRIAGVDDYSAESVAQVERVASVIASMGFQVDVVAGSSPQPVDLLLSEIGEDGMTTTVGWATQEWSTIGAATRVVEGLGSTNLALLVAAVVASIILCVGQQALQVAIRTREMAVMASLGWSRRRSVEWIVAEAVWAGAIVVCVGLTVWLIGGAAGWIGPVLAVVLASLPVTTAFATTWLLSIRLDPVIRLRNADATVTPAFGGLRVVGPKSYGLRAAAAYPLRSLLLASSLGIAAAAVSTGVVVVAYAASMAGPTRLAATIVALLNPWQMAMLVSVAGATLVPAFTLLGQDRVSRSIEQLVLTASGWPRREVRIMVMAARAAVAVPATIIAAALTGLLSVALFGQPQWLAIALAPVIVVAAMASDGLWSAKAPGHLS